MEVRQDAMFEDMLDIADDASRDIRMVGDEGNEREVVDHEHIARSKLRVDTRKWNLSRMNPRKYGDKVALTGGGDGDAPLKHEITVKFRPSNGS